MSLLIDDPDVAALARLLAAKTGESVEEAVAKAIQNRLDAQLNGESRPFTVEDLLDIGRECAALPVLDDRTPDDLPGYDRWGLPQ